MPSPNQASPDVNAAGRVPAHTPGNSPDAPSAPAEDCVCGFQVWEGICLGKGKPQNESERTTQSPFLPENRAVSQVSWNT